MSQQSDKVTASVTWLSPEQSGNTKDPVDTLPSEKQPPGVDDDWEPQSLEEALLGE